MRVPRVHVLGPLAWGYELTADPPAITYRVTLTLFNCVLSVIITRPLP